MMYFSVLLLSVICVLYNWAAYLGQDTPVKEILTTVLFSLYLNRREPH